MTDTTSSAATACTIRRFDPSDRDQFLSLYETVFERERSVDWFRWKYERNPFVDHVPIVVAEDEDRVVGCRSFLAQEMRVDGSVRLAFQPCDTMVHPDYREQGLFSRMNEFALDRYAERQPAFCFNFPNENSKPGNLNHGWQEVGTVPVYYRPQDPLESARELADDGDTAETSDDGVTETDTDGGGTGDHRSGDENDDGIADALGDAFASSQLAGDQLVTRSSDEVTVVRFETPPAELLETTYRRAIPEEIHTNRSAEFYGWRFENPVRTYLTYVATRDGERPVAALVCSAVDDHLRIVETLPRRIEAEPTAIDRLLTTVFGDWAHRNYVTAFGETLPSPIKFRFYPDTRFPLSTLIEPTARTLLARDLGDGGRCEETEIGDWALSRLDLDTT